MRLSIALAIFGILIFSSISFAEINDTTTQCGNGVCNAGETSASCPQDCRTNTTRNITDTPELSLRITTASTANGEFIYILIKNTGGRTNLYTISIDYGDGTSENKTFTQSISKNRAVSQRFVHKYANGMYRINAVVSTPGELNTFNNAAGKTITIKRNRSTPKNITEKSSNSATGRAIGYNSEGNDFFSRLMKMLG